MLSVVILKPLVFGMRKVTFFVGESTSVDLGSIGLLEQPVCKNSVLRLLVTDPAGEGAFEVLEAGGKASGYSRLD